MDALERQARAAIEGLGERRRTQRIPKEARTIVMRYATRERDRGRPWSEIADAVGLSTSALIRWSRGERGGQRGHLARVQVGKETPAPDQSLVLVSPGGYRLEGLDVTSAVDLLRALS